MKLNTKLPLLIGVVVLVTSASIILAANLIAARSLEKAYNGELASEVKLNAELLRSELETSLVQLWEIANRARTRTMEWEDMVRPNLMPDISRIDVLELGLVYPDGTAHYVSDNSTAYLGDRDYVIRAFAGESNVSDVLISRVINAAVVMLATPVLRNDEPGAPVIGVLVARKTGDKAMNQLVNAIRPSFEGGYAFLVNREGTYMAHPNSDLVFNQYNPISEAEKDPSLRSFADMLTSALKEEKGSVSYTHEGKKMVGNFTRVPGNPWTLFVVTTKDDFQIEISSMRNIILLIGLLCLFGGLIVAVLIGRSIARPMKYIAGELKEAGSGDFTRSINIKSKDEIGELAHHFNEMLQSIKEMIANVKKEASVLSGIGTELASNMNQTAAAINQITANTQSIKNQMINESASVTESNATMEQITVNINKLNDHIERQTTSVAQSSSAIEEMIANINSVTQALIKNKENVTALTDNSEAGRTGLQEVAANINEIARESEGLLEINSVMENIASQTNLLSMNAAIEAAHAGEAGKGFAVVAAEIRKLAENSSQQSKTISTVLKKIKSSIDTITRSTDNVLNKFEAMSSSVNIVAEQEENIRNAMEEQGHGSNQILEAIGQVNEITQQVKSEAKEMLEGSQEVIRESANLTRLTEEVTGGINEMAAGADQINIAVNQVNELSVRNSSNIDLLINGVSRFKME